MRTATLVYDRQDRSRGIGYVTYYNSEDALAALDSYNGQKAYGQTIYLSMAPANPGRSDAGRNAPSRSLFDRIERPLERRITDDRDRSSSPRRARHSDVSRPAPENIDRYVPGGGRNDRRRSPPARRGGGERGGRRPGQAREQSGRREGGARSGARPRKTQEELDAEMADYFEKPKEAVVAPAAAPTNGTAAAAAAPVTDDIDMIE